MGILRRLLKKINKFRIDNIDWDLRLWYGYKLIRETDDEIHYYKFISGDCECPSVQINVYLYKDQMKIDDVNNFINSVPGSRTFEEQVSLLMTRMRLKWK